MTKTTRGFLSVVTAAFLTVPAVLWAQEQKHEHGEDAAKQEASSTQCPHEGHAQGQMMGMMSQMSMGAMGRGPAMLLAQKDALGLSDEQIERIKAVQDQLAETHKSHMSEMRPIHQGLMEAQQADDPDTGQIESLLGQMAQGHVQLHMEMFRLAGEALDVLTPEQRENARYGMKMMRHMMGRMSGCGMGMMSGDMRPGAPQHGGDSS